MTFKVPETGQQENLILRQNQLFDIMSEIEIEVMSAEQKFPKWPLDLNYGDQIVNEEKGEATKALLDICQGKSTIDHVRKEYIQTAAMCVRQIAALDRTPPAF